MLCGADDLTGIEAFGKAKIEWFKRFLELENEIPSHDTFGRVLSLLSPKAFQACFRDWVESVRVLYEEEIIAVDGKLPVNIMVAAEGEEELGSPHYHQVIDAYYDRLKTADGALFPFNSQIPDGSINMILGVKGILYFEMTAQGGDWGGPSRAEIHGSYKAVVDSPVWRLVKALSSLTSPDGNTVYFIVLEESSGLSTSIWRVAFAERSASRWTSSATTANPRPASPAIDAWMDALSARIFVCSAMSLMSSTILPIS